MTTSFPGGQDSFTNPIGSDSESTIPHHLQHTNANNAILALEAKVGIDNSTLGSTLDYMMKQSINPGHSHTGQVSFQNIALTGLSAQSGAGLWTNGTSIYITTASSVGAVYLRANGPSGLENQFIVSSDGHVASSDTSGAPRNYLDDGAGNAVIAGNLSISGTLNANTLSANWPFPPPSPDPTLAVGLNLDPTEGNSDGSSINMARADHQHTIAAFDINAIPKVAFGTGNAGSKTTVSRDDHVHPAPQPVAATLIPTNQTIVHSSNGVPIAGAQPVQITNMIFNGNVGGITLVNDAMVVPLAGLYSISYQVQWQNSGHWIVEGALTYMYAELEGHVFTKPSGTTQWNPLIVTRTTVAASSLSLLEAIDAGYPSCSGTLIAPLGANDQLGLFAYQTSKGGTDQATTYFDPKLQTGMPQYPGLSTWISVQLIQ